MEDFILIVHRGMQNSSRIAPLSYSLCEREGSEGNVVFMYGLGHNLWKLTGMVV